MTGNDPLEPVQMPSDQSGNEPSYLPTETPSAAVTAAVEPIIVENTLWSSANPQAYGGGVPTQITHLREHEGLDKGDTGRWRALDIIPTKADYVLDLIRLNSLWPLTSG